MKKILLFLMMFLAAEARECVVESQDILTPWNSPTIRNAIGCEEDMSDRGRTITIGGYVFPDMENNLLKSLVCKGEFDSLREEYFPQVEASFKALDTSYRNDKEYHDPVIYLSTGKTDLNDLVAYYNLSTICAAFRLMPGANDYLAQQDSENRKSILNNLKGVLYEIHQASCSDITEAEMSIGEGEEFPLYVVIRKPGCSSIRLFILEHTNNNVPYYLRFDMTCADVEKIKDKWDEVKSDYQRRIEIYKKTHTPNPGLDPIFEELSFTEFYLAVKGLSPRGEEVSAMTECGCMRQIVPYTIEDIKNMFENDQW